MAGVRVPTEWLEFLLRQPETGMGYQVVSVTLQDGRCFKQVVVCDGFFTQVRGYKEMPFSFKDNITSIKVTHKRWDFHKG